MTPSTLRLWLEGPLQAWGTSSRFETRGTDLLPSKSGVIGLLAAALGRGRNESVDDLAACRFGVRVVQQGSVLRDYHSVGAADGDGIVVSSGSKGRGIVTNRYYLEDAAFVAALESDDRALLEAAVQALQAPHWPLALGRRSCPPSSPIWQPGALIGEPLEAALRASWDVASPHDVVGLADATADPLALMADDAVHVAIEDLAGETEVYDQPLGAAFLTRQFALRRVRTRFLLPEAA
jgi:CRISPR system Cascade subunit CasD